MGIAQKLFVKIVGVTRSGGILFTLRSKEDSICWSSNITVEHRVVVAKEKDLLLLSFEDERCWLCLPP